MNLGTIFPLQLQAVQARRVDLFWLSWGALLFIMQSHAPQELEN